jgi:hypothetical protein
MACRPLLSRAHHHTHTHPCSHARPPSTCAPLPPCRPGQAHTCALPIAPLITNSHKYNTVSSSPAAQYLPPTPNKPRVRAQCNLALCIFYFSLHYTHACCCSGRSFCCLVCPSPRSSWAHGRSIRSMPRQDSLLISRSAHWSVSTSLQCKIIQLCAFRLSSVRAAILFILIFIRSHPKVEYIRSYPQI